MSPRPPTAATQAIRAARDFLFAHATDYDGAVAGFAWPELDEFNFALEWFDVVAAEHPDRPAVMIAEQGSGAPDDSAMAVAGGVTDSTENGSGPDSQWPTTRPGASDGGGPPDHSSPPHHPHHPDGPDHPDGRVRSWTYGELSARSDQVAAWLRRLGLKRGDRMIVMLPNTIELWEILLALLKVGGVAIPTSTLLSPADLAFRAKHAQARFAIAPNTLKRRFRSTPHGLVKIGVGEIAPPGWIDFADSRRGPTGFEPDGPTPADDTCLLYFTSGTTSRPKLVRHTQASYPVGHLSTMWWLGLRPGDVHLNISSPGWGKHAWSNFFAPFLAQATVFIVGYDRFDAPSLMRVLDRNAVTTFCAPPTVWRMLIQADLTGLRTPPRELVGAGEPLNPEVIAQVRAAWGGTIRDGFGQTEMTCAIGNSPGQPVKDGSMGRPMPGYHVALIDPATGQPADEGEICLDLSRPRLPLATGYEEDEDLTARAYRNGYYHTGDLARRDADGYLTYIGRADDVFKASDYKISPFELESILLEHPYVTEVAIIPSPDPVRAAVPKAFVRLRDGLAASSHDAATAIFDFARTRLAGYQRVRIVEFVTELPKTISGKIRRVDLREREAVRVANGDRPVAEYHERDLR